MAVKTPVSLGSKNGGRHPEATKAKVVSALLAGSSQLECEALYGVPQQTVSGWAQELGGIDALRQGRVSDLVYKYLTENLTTLEVQSRHFRNTEWLAVQNASDLATLHGVCADKAVRILAAMERAAGSE